MLFKFHNYQTIELINTKSEEKIFGLDDFKKSLELGYFSEVTIKNAKHGNQKMDLVLELDCPLSLIDVLGHFNKGLWGATDINGSTLTKSFGLLTTQNRALEIDIHEITLYLNDTNIIIKNIYRNSIPEQFNNIMTEIARQYVSITKGLTEQPEEIFVPVFEDNLSSAHTFYEKQKSPNASAYKEYWGIYMESEVDGLIFDVQKNKFIPANLDYTLFDENN